MRVTDFSNVGGFPLDVDTLDFMQTGYRELFTALFADVPNNQAVIITGMQLVGNDLAAGWFYLNGYIYPCAAGNYPLVGVPVGAERCILITETVEQAEYEDTSISDTYYTYTAAPAWAVPGGLAIQLSTMKLWHEYLSARGQTAWNTITVSSLLLGGGTGNVSGTILWRKNLWTKQLEVIGSLSTTNADLIALNNYYSQIATLPGVVTVGVAPFAGFIRYHNNMIADQSGGELIQINGEVYGGIISLGFRRPAAATAYTVYFNTTAPLA